MSTVQYVIDAVPICLDPTLNFVGKLARPFFALLSEELLKFDRWCAPRCGEQLETSRSAVTVRNDELVARWKYKRGLKHLAFGHKIPRKVSHMQLLRREELRDCRRFVLELTVTIISGVNH